MLRSLVGSEMCIRDSYGNAPCDYVFISAAIALTVLAVVFLIASSCSSKAQSFLTAICFVCVALLSVMQIIALRTNTDSIEAIKSSLNYTCLLYTSDAADEEDSVDLGGRRIIKKKNRKIDVMRFSRNKFIKLSNINA
eukprot:TRINITY_DN44783_c0_g1_i4.p1 TRINITY_DN44783_c0_g1~~TRINITY_DN44783_c0_g1_i4.p1  ORF type:complete len:138 (-),score=15.52 TRINITY_DN44783_c0_g1_i4:49-462(-)